VSSILIYDPGQSGSMTQPPSTDSGLESLRPIGLYLTRRGYTVNIRRASVDTQLRDQVAVSTTTGWLLTWSRKTTRGWEVCGSLWAGIGVEVAIPFTLE